MSQQRRSMLQQHTYAEDVCLPVQLIPKHLSCEVLRHFGCRAVLCQHILHTCKQSAVLYFGQHGRALASCKPFCPWTEQDMRIHAVRGHAVNPNMMSLCTCDLPKL